MISIFVNNGYSDEDLKIIIDYFSKTNIQYYFAFMITNEIDYKKTEKTINNLEIKSYQYIPLYNKTNLNFFKEMVFIDESDIIELKNNQINIFQNQKINMLDFGTLTFLPDGNCYTNINSEPIGNIFRNSIYYLIFHSLTHDREWFITRNKVEPCKECHFSDLCPPISNYERIIKRNNLCNIAN